MEIYKNSFVDIVVQELQAKQHHQRRSLVSLNLVHLPYQSLKSPTTLSGMEVSHAV
jgi:hypothetical protein